MVWFAILTSKCASGRNAVQMFNSHLTRRLRIRRLSEPTFDPPESQTSGKTMRPTLGNYFEVEPGSGIFSF